jgi:integrase/recombinase XerD
MNTISAYKKDLEQFISVWKTARKSSTEELYSNNPVEIYVEWLKEQDYQPSTIARKCAAIRGYLEFHDKDDVYSLSYLDNFLRNLSPTRKSPKVLLKSEINSLLAAPLGITTPLALRDAAILALMYETGIRAAEVIGLLINAYDSLENRILIPSVRSAYFSLGEVGSRLDRYLQEGRPHLARIPDEEHLFLNQRGKGLTRQGIWFVVKHWAEEAGIEKEISPNTIRHSRIQHLLDSGLSNREVLRKIGLRSPNSLRAFNS